tara:strand:- start:935 stop:1129 length:195 start_codon:yes stop_codon:yes gene_type:complete
MKTDKDTKLLLTVIAIALIIIEFKSMAYTKGWEADDDAIQSSLSDIKSIVSNIGSGICLNEKIC